MKNNRNRPIDTENKLMAAQGEEHAGVGEKDPKPRRHNKNI